MHPQLTAERCARPGWPLHAVACALGLLAGCGAVQVAPMPKLPRALISQIPAHVGVIVAGDMRNYTHKETRAGAGWAISLGPGHQKFSQELFSALFREASLFPDAASTRAAAGLAAIFEPRIEQFSFATAQETGGSYFAVTIKYRIALTTAAGELVDAFTLTGYGTSLAGGMSSGAPLGLAAQAAMRDAAAKFLVQFPEQAVARQLASAQPLVAQSSEAAAAAKDPIEAVPVKESAVSSIR
jgi:hypothetical protein